LELLFLLALLFIVVWVAMGTAKESDDAFFSGVESEAEFED